MTVALSIGDAPDIAHHSTSGSHATVVRLMEMADLVSRKVVERLEVVGVIAERQHFAAKERTREHREREKREECECEPAIHCRAQKSCTISRISRTPGGKKLARMRSSVPCT